MILYFLSLSADIAFIPGKESIVHLVSWLPPFNSILENLSFALPKHFIKAVIDSVALGGGGGKGFHLGR